MAPPVIEVLAEPGAAGDELRPLLLALGRTCRVRASDPRLSGVAARIATGPGALGLAEAARSDVPLACFVPTGTPVPPGVEVAIVTKPLPEAGPPTVVLPHPAVDAGSHPPVPPFVRARWRRRLGLRDDLVVALGVAGADPLPDSFVPTALAVAAAAIVVGPAASTALALGTPTVTDAATAERLGAAPGEEVVVADRAERDAAAALAADLPAAARLHRGAAGWTARHDVGVAAGALVAALGIRPAAPGAARFEARLSELGVPAWSAPAQRARAALAWMLAEAAA